MAGSDDEQGSEKPSEQRGGTTPDEAEAREKGQWAGNVEDGVVPAELGGSDAPREMLDEDPELDSSVLGRTTGSDEPATEEGIDPAAATMPARRPTVAPTRRGRRSPTCATPPPAPASRTSTRPASARRRPAGSAPSAGSERRRR